MDLEHKMVLCVNKDNEIVSYYSEMIRVTEQMAPELISTPFSVAVDKDNVYFMLWHSYMNKKKFIDLINNERKKMDLEDLENINEVEGENLEKKVEQLNSAIADVRKQLEELGQ